MLLLRWTAPIASGFAGAAGGFALERIGRATHPIEAALSFAVAIALNVVGLRLQNEALRHLPTLRATTVNLAANLAVSGAVAVVAKEADGIKYVLGSACVIAGAALCSHASSPATPSGQGRPKGA